MSSSGGNAGHFQVLALLHVGLAGAHFLTSLLMMLNVILVFFRVRAEEGLSSLLVSFTAIGAVIVLVFMLLSAVQGWLGVCLFRRFQPAFVRLAAWLVCLLLPLGTFLGVVTLLMLRRPRARELFR